jgi:malate permease and related proteins
MFANLLLDILAPILLMVGLGALMRRKFKINVDTLSKVNIYLFTPAFIFDRVTRSKLHSADMAGIASYTAMLVVSLGLLVWALGRVRKLERRRLAALAMAAMFYNSGNFGLPLAELAYPHVDGGGMKDGAAVQTFVVLTQNVLTFTLGLAIAAGAHAHTPMHIAKKMLSLPVLYTLTAALVGRHFFGPESGRDMPALISNVSKYLGDGLVPVALITLGAQLASSARWPQWKDVSFAIFMRLIMGPVLMTGLLLLFHWRMPGTWLDLWPWPAESLILTAGVPSAINTLLLVLELDGDAELTADCVFWTTIASAVTIFGWLTLLRMLFPALGG